LIEEYEMLSQMVFLFLKLKRIKFSMKKLGLKGLMMKEKKAQYDYIAKNIIISALNSDEFSRVSQCGSAKEM